jgi:outer membrane lipoprotein SlyB
MKHLYSIGTAIAVMAVSMVGCAGPEPQPYYASQGYASQQPPSYSVGVVDRIEVIRTGDGNNVAGTVIGGIVGGLIGHQIGSGRGQTAATVIGAAGGAVAGSQIEQRSRRANETFRITVRLDAGGYQTVTQEDLTDLRTGDRVRLEGGRVHRY